MTLNRNQMRVRLGASAIAIATALTLGGVASAQVDELPTDEADVEEDVIVVEGFRSSLGAALRTKRNETGIVDAIVAEDIADFPDLNLAESLQRIPGVSISRQAGEGRQITVRGLGGLFTRTRINGMESISTTGASDAGGGSNRSRSFDFNTFASELFNELVVRKTQSASVEEGSLGANVELKTAQPFDYGPGVTGTLFGSALYNDLSEDVGPRVGGLVSYTNPSETFGALLSVAYQDRTIREEGFSTVRFDDFGVFRSVGGVPCTGDPLPTDCETLRNSYYARIPRYGRLDYDQKRLGITSALQFRLSERTVLSIDGLYSKFDGERQEDFLEVFIRSNTDNVDVTDFTVNGDGVLSRLVGDLQADVSNGLVPARIERRRDELSTEFYQFTGNLEHEFNDRFRGNIFGGASKSDFDVPQQATIFFDAANPVTGYTYDFTDNPNAAFVDFGSLDVNDPSSFLFTQFRNRPQGVENKYATIQANFAYDLNDAITLSAGFSWKKFDFLTFEGRAEGNVADLAAFGAPVVVTADLVDPVTGFGQGLDAPNGIDTSWAAPNFDAAASLVGLFDVPTVRRDQDTRGVEETDVGGYVQFDFNFDVGGMPVRGDFGVRYVETRLSSTGIIGDAADPATVERSYDDWLPAFNIVLEASDDFLIRAGYGQVIARPALGNLTPGGSIDTFTGPPFTLDNGNPFLDPFRATNLDVSLEWYFQPEALLAVSFFYKDVESFFTQSQTIETTFSATGLPVSVASPTSPLAILLAAGDDPAVDVNTTVNGSNGKIKGLEFVYQQNFTGLPGLFGNTGFIGNYTYVDSATIIGFSDHAFNATFYYEDSRFGARLSGAYRTDYLTRNPNSSGRTAGREERGVASTFNLDFAAQYQVSENIELTFDVLNITDEYERQTFDQLQLPTVYHHTGRNFILGARYNF